MIEDIFSENLAFSQTQINEINPLMNAADALLSLMPKLRITKKNDHPELLRQEILDEIQKFEIKCTNQNLSYESIIGSRYCLCSALDEAIMSTSWGREIVWNQSGLLVTFHNETWGGEKFFQLLSRLCKNSPKNIDLIELQTYCLLLGFEGRYRVLENGKGQLETLKKRMVQLIQSIRGKKNSIFFQPLENIDKNILSSPPLSFTAATVISLLIILTVYFLYLEASKDFTANVMNNIITAKIPIIKIKPEIIKDEFAQLRQLLASEIENNTIVLINENHKHTIRVSGDGFFNTGKARLTEKSMNIINHIGESIRNYDGQIMITGHTDNIPIHNRTFSSNNELSLARAKTIESIFNKLSIPSSRMVISGEGEKKPLVENNSEKNRAINRRVEIILLDHLNQKFEN
ncbi:type IVB secretion system protein IcmH/DotU [Pantoea agglomerans]|uniref:type IVB secretion system protein IcmH/DotU n=1 Tax=Enterobacter agglomerans TaxID=549 RepID=UPI00301E5BCF